MDHCPGKMVLEIEIVLETIIKTIESGEKKKRQVLKEKAWEKAIDTFNYKEFQTMHSDKSEIKKGNSAHRQA